MNARVERVFHEVADLTAETRTQYFAENGVDEETRREVEALLSFDARASGFLERDVSAAAGWALTQIEARGRHCGPFRLLDVVGRGGMGAVYLAERADGEVTQRVAVKLLPPGAGAPQRERFLQERQILATLAHPNIARMLDAGHLDNGQPFLVMEYVNGKPIDVFVAEFSVRQKIALFLKVCAAVAYSHRNLVVHRDLKPSNILVTMDGEPKLLDFGIAKILDLTADSTITNMRMLTPEYASPEQVMRGRASTATDIYSLGAVLYRLLTGKPPHEFEEHSPEAIASVIMTREVTRPSTLAPELKGDIEVILLKALRKDAQERYATVEQFAEDLEAFLKSRPVRARSGNTWYRTRKFLRRYWLSVSAASLAVISLLVGLTVANRERALAQRRFEDVREISNKLFDIDEQVTDLSGSSKVRQLIVNTALQYLQRLRADAADDASLLFEVAKGYLSVAEAEGVTNGPNLGQTDRAARDLNIAEKLFQRLLSKQPGNRSALLFSAAVASDQALLEYDGYYDEKHTQGFQRASKADELLKRFNPQEADRSEGPAGRQFGVADRVLYMFEGIARDYTIAERFDDALRVCERGVDLAQAFGMPKERCLLLSASSEPLRFRGDLDGALTATHKAVMLMNPNSDAVDTSNFVLTLWREGLVLGEDGGISLARWEEAVRVLQRGFDLMDPFVHRDVSDEASVERLELVGTALADILRHVDARRALAIYDHTLRHVKDIDSRTMRRAEVTLLAGSSYALTTLGRRLKARQRLDAAFAVLAELKLYPSDRVVTGSEAERALCALAEYEGSAGNTALAIGTYTDLLRRMQASGGKPQDILRHAVEFSNIWASMAVLYRRAGNPALASDLKSRQLNLWRLWDHKLPHNSFVDRQLRAAAPV